MRKPTQHGLVIFKREASPAKGKKAPVGMKASKVPLIHGVFSGVDKEHKLVGFVHEVWLCDIGKSPEAKIKKLYEMGGPTGMQACEHFIEIWTPDKEQNLPPQCPADGYTPTAIMEGQMEML